MPADPRKSNMWADKESGQVVRVDKVDEHWATITVIKALPSHWSMPVKDYDGGLFTSRFNVVDAGEMVLPDGYRPPADSLVEAESDIDAARGETDRGVQIGA